MNKTLILVLTVAIACSWACADDTSNYLKQTVKKAETSLGVVKCEVTSDAGTQILAGPGVCIDAKTGLMLTFALDSRLDPEEITKLEVLLPGEPVRTLPAKFLGLDPVTGLSFVQVSGDHKLSAIAFMKTANVEIGERVASVGIVGNESSLSTILGTGFVGFKQRMPEWKFFVTGGSLSPIGAVVFDSKGRAIGLVGTQPYQRYQSTSQRGLINLTLKSEDYSIAFQPAEEFVYIFSNIPRDGKVRRVPWLGVVNFDPVQPDLAAAKGIQSPAIMIGEIIPGSEADKAGLTNRDVIIAVNGKPLEKFASPNMGLAAFMRDITRMESGQTVKLTVLSGPQRRDVDLLLTPMPTRPNEAPQMIDKSLGMLIREKVPMDSFLDKGPAASVPGLLVMAVGENSPAYNGGLRNGDVITAINNTPVKTVQEGKALFNEAVKQGKTVPLTIRRGEETKEISIRLPSR